MNHCFLYQNVTKLGEKRAHTHTTQIGHDFTYILREKNGRNCQIQTIASSMSPAYGKVPEKSLLSSMGCSQIWLSPLSDNHQFTYLSKLNTKKKYYYYYYYFKTLILWLQMTSRIQMYQSSQVSLEIVILYFQKICLGVELPKPPSHNPSIARKRERKLRCLFCNVGTHCGRAWVGLGGSVHWKTQLLLQQKLPKEKEKGRRMKAQLL